jgi:type I restriction enzyme M protein
MIMNDGWLEAAKPRKIVADKDRKLSETPDLVVGTGRSAVKYKMDLIPPDLIVERYFAKERAEVDELMLAWEEASRVVEEYVEEHAVEGGLLAEAMDDEKINKALALGRLKKARHEGTDADEVAALSHLIKLYNAEAVAKKAAKEAEAALNLATLKKYVELNEHDVKALVLDDKWQATVTMRVTIEVEALTLALVARMQELGSRYATTVGALQAELKRVEAQVVANLSVMGVN